MSELKCPFCEAKFEAAQAPVVRAKKGLTTETLNPAKASTQYVVGYDSLMITEKMGIPFAQWTLSGLAAFVGSFAIFFWVLVAQKGFASSPLESYFAVICTAFASASAFGALAAWFNKRVFNVKKDFVEVSVRPFSFSRKKKISLKGVRNFTVKPHGSVDKDNTPLYSYDVYGVRDTGKPLSLVKNYYAYEDALEIERALEKFLGMEDDPSIDVEGPPRRFCPACKQWFEVKG